MLSDRTTITITTLRFSKYEILFSTRFFINYLQKKTKQNTIAIKTEVSKIE